MKNTKELYTCKNIYDYLKNRTDLDFENDNEYFEYIESSWLNGQKKQCLQLYFDMDQRRKEDFLNDTENMDLLKYILYSVAKEGFCRMSITENDQYYEVILND